MRNDLTRYPVEQLGPDDDDGTMPNNVAELGEHVIGHRIVSAERDGRTFTITLDTGTRVELADTDDCCASTELDAFLLHPERVVASDFEKLAVQRLIDKATALGIEVPKEVAEIVCTDRSNIGAMLWARANPGVDGPGCCWGDVNGGPEDCTCWTPVFDVDQATPVPPAMPGDLEVQSRICGDCAYRKDSPERADAYTEEALLALPAQGQAFYCHDGMRRPVRWEHPDGRTVDGSPDDWQPPTVRGVPFRTDGRPGLLCAGWAARAGRTP